MAGMRLKEMTALRKAPCRRLDWRAGWGESYRRDCGTLDENDTGGVCGRVRTSVCACWALPGVAAGHCGRGLRPGNAALATRWQRVCG